MATQTYDRPRNPAGRRGKAPEDRLGQRVRFACSFDLYDGACVKAYRLGVTVSEYLRGLVERDLVAKPLTEPKRQS